MLCEHVHMEWSTCSYKYSVVYTNMYMYMLVVHSRCLPNKWNHKSVVQVTVISTTVKGPDTYMYMCTRVHVYIQHIHNNTQCTVYIWLLNTCVLYSFCSHLWPQLSQWKLLHWYQSHFGSPSENHLYHFQSRIQSRERMCVWCACVSVCVCVWDREREKER